MASIIQINIQNLSKDKLQIQLIVLKEYLLSVRYLGKLQGFKYSPFIILFDNQMKPNSENHRQKQQPPFYASLHQQKREIMDQLNFQQVNEAEIAIKTRQKNERTLKIISISILILITVLLLMMGNTLAQTSNLMNIMINEHHENIDLQAEFENEVTDIKITLREIKKVKIGQEEQQGVQLELISGIISKYQTNIIKVEQFLKRPQMLIEGDLDAQTNILLDLRKSKASLQKLANNKDYTKKEDKDYLEFIDENYKLDIPKNIWVFKENPYNYIRKLTNQNRFYYSQISGYNIHFVNYDSMRTFLPKSIQRNIKRGIQSLEKKLSGQNLHFASKKLILLGFLQTHGGIMLDGLYTITENLTWIQEIITNKFVSRGNRYVQPKIVTFYNPLQSGQKQLFNIIPFEGMQQTDKYVLEYPKIEEYFIAAKKGTQFIERLITKIYEIINDIDNFWKYNQFYKMKYDKIQDFTKNIIYIASRIILIQKQQQLDSSDKNIYKIFAFDYYGINCINTYYGPSKSSIIYQRKLQSITNLQSYYHTIYHDLARYSYQQLTSYIGNFKYLSNFNFEYFLNNFIEKSSKGKDIEIYQGSFIQKIYYPQVRQSFIISNPQKYFINETNQIWSSLNPIIWILQQKQQKSQWTKMCIYRIQQIASRSNFQIKFINQHNIMLYLSQQIILKITSTIKKSTLDKIMNMRSYFYRLAILYQYGGIFIEESTLSLESYDIIMNIGRYPSQFIFNRFDSLPKVLMFFNPYPRYQQKWGIHSITKDKNCKAQWHQQFLHEILIAEENNQFIGQWLDTLFQVVVMKKYEIQELLRKYKINEHKSSDWIRSNIFFIDIAKFILGRKQTLLEEEKNKEVINSAHYYKIWTINAYLTPFKLKQNNYQSSQLVNPYLYQFPRQTVEQIIGGIHFHFPITDISEPMIDNQLNQDIEAQFYGKINSRSLFKEMIRNSSKQFDSSNKKS